jgi:YidC/Oxa1 family membrane protein insertase
VSTSPYLAGAFPIIGSALGQIFQPLYQAMAWILAACYAFVPNVAVAIAILTVVVMILTAPLTIRSIRSALAMQRLAPELRKLQQKYKGDRAQLNEAMSALYRHHGVSPLSGLLPAVLQIPAYVVLYGVIRGLTHTIDGGRVAAPLYVNHGTALAQSLHRHPGHLPAFGINLASSVLSSHPSWPAYLPYGALVVAAVALQWLQTSRLNHRSQTGGTAPAPTWQRYLPLVFGLVYLRLPAGLTVYIVVSGACRIAIQELALRSRGPGVPGSESDRPKRLPGRRLPERRRYRGGPWEPT